MRATEDMKLAKQYTPNDYEPTIYALWEESQSFRPSGKGEPYSIVMPPPNANGNLHIGHALDMNLKDILARFQRLKGRDVAFIPGADHAGFETWVVFERQLQKDKKSRFDFSREELYGKVWDFVEARRGDMELQLRALGTSCSWDHLVFTLDEKVIKTVYATFKKMWDDGLIYRGERIVNYCTVHKTSFADIEVEYKNDKSKIWKIAYPLLDSIGEIVVATTRPETMLGDTAVAVHPDDERYKHLIGTKVLLPIVNRELTIIGDEHVDKDFGTGAVKITPAHDNNDFEMASRHDLKIINIIDEEGKMVNVPSQFEGLTIEECRSRVLASLEAEEFRRGESDIEHSVGHCYKCGTMIQPLMKDQWFINLKPLSDTAMDRLNNQEINFNPASKQKEVVNYLKQIKDWNISRQIPWGIPIPAFQNKDNPADWIYDTRVDEKSIVVNGATYLREEDTFDTWFSSGQWPFIVTDYLDEGELSSFFPTTIMETGSDLLRQWVSRMIMLSVYRTDKVPFKQVYFHGMVNDENNQKMSKSKGNVINPMELVSEYGSDAVRLGMIAGRSPAQNQPFNRGAVVAGRNFCNKLWNIARYSENIIDKLEKSPEAHPTDIADHWIVRQLNNAIKGVESHLGSYRFSEAAEVVYHVIWDDVADWYIESMKVSLNKEMLAYVLDTCLKLAHPFAPFVTETIWQTLDWHEKDDLLIKSTWPTSTKYNEIAASEFERLQALVSEVRLVSTELPGNNKYNLLFQDDFLIADNSDLIKQLAKLKDVVSTDEPQGLRLSVSGRNAFLDVDSKTIHEHRNNLEKRLQETSRSIENLKSRLSNESYVSKAPAKLVEESKTELAEQTKLAERLSHELSTLEERK